MKIELWYFSHSKKSEFDQWCLEFDRRIQRYIPFHMQLLKDPEGNMKEASKQMDRILSAKLKATDLLILLDEKGKEYTSEQFSEFLSDSFQIGKKRIVFVIGGSYGFQESDFRSSAKLIAISKMTFTHEMARLFFLEQLYRAFTIIRHQPYHH